MSFGLRLRLGHSQRGSSHQSVGWVWEKRTSVHWRRNRWAKRVICNVRHASNVAVGQRALVMDASWVRQAQADAKCTPGACGHEERRGKREIKRHFQPPGADAYVCARHARSVPRMRVPVDEPQRRIGAAAVMKPDSRGRRGPRRHPPLRPPQRPRRTQCQSRRRPPRPRSR